MILDYNSLLLAIGFSAACLSVTLFGSWMSSRKEGFVLTWAIGATLIVVNVFAYHYYVRNPSIPALMFAACFLMAGFATLLAAAHQFRDGRHPARRILFFTAVSLTVVLPPMALGFDGAGFIAYNLAAAALLGLTARAYWTVRDEAPGPIGGITVLYGATGISFFLCAYALVSDGRMVLGQAPVNWAEDLNLAMAIGGMSGAGALSLALNHWRLADAHLRDAMTDSLTGLLNRRALFDNNAQTRFGPFHAVIVFDLDRFKMINDRYGHAAGDAVLQAFARELVSALRPGDSAARLGGEEFAIVLQRTLPERAELVAERVRASFASRPVSSPAGDIACTVSAGIAFGHSEGADFAAILHQADRALYAAKDTGRNRVVSDVVRIAPLTVATRAV